MPDDENSTEDKPEVDRRSFLHGLGTFGGLGLVAGPVLGSSLLASCGQDGLTTATVTTSAGSSSAGSAVPSGSMADLASRLKGTLVLPEDSMYAAAKLVFNRRYQDVRPAAIAYCESADDVRTSMQFARERELPFRARCGGHSYAGYSTTEGGIIIDVSRMSAVNRLGDTDEVEVQSGARLFDVYQALWQQQRAIPAGSCPSVGVSGLTLGGGLGALGRIHGTTADSLVALEMVTADGRIVRADANENSDLFWACRGGGGGNFGIVTRLRFRTHPVGANALFEYVFPIAAAPAVFDAWQRLAPFAPDALYTVAKIQAIRPAGGGRKVASVFVGGEFQGPEAEMRDLIEPVVSAGRAVAEPISGRQYSGQFIDGRLFWGKCEGYSSDECHLDGDGPGLRENGRIMRPAHSPRSQIFDRLMPAATIEAAVRWVERRVADDGAGDGLLFAEPLGGQFNRVAPDATAFVHRTDLFWTEIVASWDPAAPTDRVDKDLAWVSGFFEETRPASSGRVYQNFPDPLLADWLPAAYGTNLDRLIAVKRAWDPDNAFAFPLGIPTS